MIEEDGKDDDDDDEEDEEDDDNVNDVPFALAEVISHKMTQVELIVRRKVKIKRQLLRCLLDGDIIGLIFTPPVYELRHIVLLW